MKEGNIDNNNDGQANNIDMPKKENVITAYTNSVSLAFGYYDFQLVFREQYPSLHGEGTESANYIRLMMSPQHAKILNIILEKNIRNYESSFGKIETSEEFLKSLNLINEG